MADSRRNIDLIEAAKNALEELERRGNRQIKRALEYVYEFEDEYRRLDAIRKDLESKLRDIDDERILD